MMNQLHAAVGTFMLASAPYAMKERFLYNKATLAPKYVFKTSAACTNSNFQNNYFVKTRGLIPTLETHLEKECGSAEIDVKKPRVLCLHGYRASGDIFKKQLEVKWPKQVLEKMDLVFPNGPTLARGKSDIEGIFDPPYYEWFQFNKEYHEYTSFDDVEMVNLEEGVAYIEDYMIKHGPFDGLFGFSQGAGASAVLLGLQEKGLALTEVPEVKFGILIAGARFKHLPSIAENAFSSPIQCPTLHIIGKRDYLRPYSLKLLETCVDSIAIHHRKGHTIPGLDDKDLLTVLSFIEKISKDLAQREDP